MADDQKAVYGRILGGVEEEEVVEVALVLPMTNVAAFLNSLLGFVNCCSLGWSTILPLSFVDGPLCCFH